MEALWRRVYYKLSSLLCARSFGGPDDGPAGDIACNTTVQPVCQPMQSVTTQWVADARRRITSTLRWFDTTFPGRIGGVCANNLHTSEWMLMALSPLGYEPDYSKGMQHQFCQGSSDSLLTVWPSLLSETAPFVETRQG